MAKLSRRKSQRDADPLQVDPRIQRRRQQVRNDLRKHRKRVLIGVLSTVTVVLLGFGVLWTPLFAVEHVNVISQDGTIRDDLISVSGVTIGDPMVNVDQHEIEQRLLAVPDVLGAEITREWPRTINMVVIEETPRLIIRNALGRFVIGEHGGVLSAFHGNTTETDAHTELLELIVETDDVVEVGTPLAGVTWVAARAVQQFPESLAHKVATATLTREGTLVVETTNEETVQFGSPEESTAKVVALQSVLASVDPECRSVIDVRDPIRITVTRSPSCLGYDPAESRPEGDDYSNITSNEQTSERDENRAERDRNDDD